MATGIGDIKSDYYGSFRNSVGDRQLVFPQIDDAVLLKLEKLKKRGSNDPASHRGSVVTSEELDQQFRIEQRNSPTLSQRVTTASRSNTFYGLPQPTEQVEEFSKASPKLQKIMKRTFSTDDLSNLSTPIARSRSNSGPDVTVLTQGIPQMVQSEASNPTLGEEISINLELIKKELRYLFKLKNYFGIFDKKLAVATLSSCIKRFPENIDLIVEVVLSLRNSLHTTKRATKRERLDKILALATINLQNSNIIFIKLFLQKSGNRCEFAKFAVTYLLKKHKNIDLISTLSRFTELDLQETTIATMFREENISSTFCRAYAELLWADQMAYLDIFIEKEFKKLQSSDLILDYDSIKRTVEEQSDWSKLNEMEQKQRIEEESGRRANVFGTLAAAVLTEIYNMEVSEPLAKLLTMRRSRIIEFLMKQPSTSQDARDQSKRYVCELLVLRLINPHLIKAPIAQPGSDGQRVMIQISKMVQCLANETRFGDEHGNLKLLNVVLDNLAPSHDGFLTKYTLPAESKK
jgi:hypothetical protein